MPPSPPPDTPRMPDLDPAPPLPREPSGSVAKRAALWTIGTLSLALGVAGIFLPVLPTTPFVLLTAACWSRASPRFHRRLLAHPRFGPIIDNWERHHSLPRRVKLLAITMLTLSIGVSIYLVRDKAWLQLMLATIALVTTIWMYRLPTREVSPASAQAKNSQET